MMMTTDNEGWIYLVVFFLLVGAFVFGMFIGSTSENRSALNDIRQFGVYKIWGDTSCQCVIVGHIESGRVVKDEQ